MLHKKSWWRFEVCPCTFCATCGQRTGAGRRTVNLMPAATADSGHDHSGAAMPGRRSVECTPNLYIVAAQWNCHPSDSLVQVRPTSVAIQLQRWNARSAIAYPGHHSALWSSPCQVWVPIVPLASGCITHAWSPLLVLRRYASCMESGSSPLDEEHHHCPDRGWYRAVAMGICPSRSLYSRLHHRLTTFI